MIQWRRNNIQWLRNGIKVSCLDRLEFWNLIDYSYILLSLAVMFMNLFYHWVEFEVSITEELEFQRMIASICVCFLWIKVFDWLRLFDGTAFFVRLIGRTFSSIKYFIIIMFVWWMMFGTAVYILDLGLPEELKTMNQVFGFWVLDAFQSQYELSHGEF